MKKRILFSVLLVLCLLMTCTVLAATDGYSYNVEGDNNYSYNNPVSVACNHPGWKLVSTEVQPSCTESGYGSYQCTSCNEMKRQQPIPALGHDKGTWVETEKATCITEGKKVLKCTRCNAQLDTGTVTKAGHTPGDWSVVTKPTCTSEGKKTRSCTVCGTVTDSAAIAKVDHSYGEWSVTKAATCTADGTETSACTVCGDKKTRSVAKKGHSYGDWAVTKAATCTADGTETSTCSACGDQKTRSVTKKGHSFGDWKLTKKSTCIEEGEETSLCSVCGEKKVRALAKGEHDFDEYKVLREPTCKAKGKKMSTCKICKTTRSKTIAKVDHAYDEGTVTKEPTDFSAGKRTRKCTMCSRKLVEEFYPEGTLYLGMGGIGGDGGETEEAVMALKLALGDMKLFSGKMTGIFDKETAAAVKKYEKKVGLKTDGIAWPGVLKMMGLISKPGEPILPPDPDSYKIRLAVTQLSPVKPVYMVGDVVTYSWTLTNTSTKYPYKKASLYTFPSLTANAKTDVFYTGQDSLGKGESMSGTFDYTVTEADCKAGSFTLGFIGRGTLNKKNTASNTVCFRNTCDAGGIGGGDTPTDFYVTKTVLNTPENGIHFVKGEDILFHISISNPTVEDVPGVMVTDPLLPKLDTNIGTLPAGKTVTLDGSYRVKAADVTAGSVTNTVTVSYLKPDSSLAELKASATALTGRPIDGPVIHVAAVSSPATGSFYVPGETVYYEITVTNPTDTTYTYLHMYDLLLGEISIDDHKTLLPGESYSVIFPWKVTELQAADKSKTLINTVKLTYQDPSMSKRSSVSGMCKVPVGFPGDDDIRITKAIISVPENGSYYQDAEEIRYEITVINNSAKDLEHFDVRDSLALFDEKGYRTLAADQSVKAGENAVFLFTYPVGPADIEDTYVLNQAAVVWNPTGKFETVRMSDAVIAPTAANMKARTPQALKLEGDSCDHILSAMGDGVTWHDLTECDVHTQTAKDSGSLVQTGRYADASELWLEDIRALYQEWLDATQGEGRLVVENDENAFKRQTAAWYHAMNLIMEDSAVENLIIESMMNKTVDLCRELHTAPDDRSDSVTAQHSALPEAAQDLVCTHVTTYNDEGAAHYVDCSCEAHRRTAEITDYLLALAEDDEDREQVWIMARGNWQTELNSLYNVWYQAADEDSRGQIAVDYITFSEAIEAREAALNELYPHDPATAAEVLAGMIQSRTQTVCSILHQVGIMK